MPQNPKRDRTEKRNESTGAAEDAGNASKITPARGASGKSADDQQHSPASPSKTVPVHHIVLTGGPCAGKSTMLSVLQTRLPAATGFKVYCVPEAATLLMGGGLEWKDMNDEKVIEYQYALLQVQLALEDNFITIAKASDAPSLIISDRSTMDGRAYCSEQQFSKILAKGGYTISELRDTRHDAVIHMVTAAIGAEKFYNYDNPVRFETIEEARASDEKLRAMYIGHPRLKVFDNSTTFEAKIDRVYDFVCEVIGHRVMPHRMRRFLVTQLPKPDDIPVSFVHVTVTLTVLSHSTPDNIASIMKREQDGACVYFHQMIQRVVDQHPVQTVHKICAREYASLLSQRDPARQDVVKKNKSFMYGDYYHELAEFLQPEKCRGSAILYVDCPNTDNLAPFLKIEKEVTNDMEYSSFKLSHRCEAKK